METKTFNIIEEIARTNINRMLDLRYDICTCQQCRQDILAETLSKLQPMALTIPPDELENTIKQISAERQAEINHTIIQTIEKIGNKPNHPIVEDRKKALKLLIDKILHERNVDFRNYHLDLLKRRFAVRIRANGLASYAEYTRLLTKNPREYDKLFETLCINVSEFYRDPPIWITLHYLFENLIRIKQQHGDKTIHIWSAGCANGEEPYSIAILLTEMIRNNASFNFEITATDIDKTSMNLAQKAIYQKDILKNLDKKFITRYFILTPEGFQLKSEIKKLVEFKYLDLTSQAFPSNIDVIFCRNVFIYFNRDLQEQLLRKFHAALNPGGYLVLGQAESMVQEVRKLFEDTDSNARIYKKPEENAE
jgi:chemotaxis protein methyltransferase CheR